MSLTKQLQRIYDSEINFSISTFWDGGIDIQLGDAMNGFVAETSERTFDDAVYWLIDKVLELYPTSFYTYARISIINKIRSGHIDTDKFTKEFLNRMIEGYENEHTDIYSELHNEYLKNYKEIQKT